MRTEDEESLKHLKEEAFFRIGARISHNEEELKKLEREPNGTTLIIDDRIKRLYDKNLYTVRELALTKRTISVPFELENTALRHKLHKNLYSRRDIKIYNFPYVVKNRVLIKEIMKENHKH